MNGLELQFAKTTKYLGVHLDPGLTMKYHINQKIASAKKHFMMLRNAIGSYWGPSPRALKWAINGIIIPSLSYGSVVWSRACQQISIRDKLTKLNRLMALSLMPVRKSTPTSGLEILLGLKPLDLRIQELALNSMTRVIPLNPRKWDGIGKSSLGHIRWGMDTLANIGVQNVNFDKFNTMNLTKQYTVDMSSFSSGQAKTTEKGVICYTDGSKLNDQTGFGYGITLNEWVLASEHGSLGPTNSVFQAEITAIQKCAEKVADENCSHVTIYSDSQAALAALENHKIKHKSVDDCAKSLNNLGLSKYVTLKWVKAHANTTGNEFADQLAKLGTTNVENKVMIPPPISWAKHKIAQVINEKWTFRWVTNNEARQTKTWLSRNDRNISRQLLLLNREELGLVVQFMTGHNRLNRHENLVNPEVNPRCRLCKSKWDKETTWHIVGECPRLISARLDSFQLPFLDEAPQWTLKQILKFMRKANFKKLNNREDPEEDTP